MIVLSIPFFSEMDFITIPLANVDYTEYRLDFCSNLPEIDFSMFAIDTILTIREQNEGGCNYIDTQTKITCLDNIHKQTRCLIDCEYLFMQEHPEVHIDPERLVLSLHTDLSQRNLIDEFMRMPYPAAHYKLAVSCKSIDQLDDIMHQIPETHKSHFSLIPLPPCSISVRLLYRLFPSEFIYVHNKLPIVGNQPGLDLAITCRAKVLNPDTEVYCIIGKEQVMASLSVKVYNKWFLLNKQNRVFLPIVAESLDEAIGQIQWLQKRAKIKGVAVTMPYKQQLAEFLHTEESVINTWLPENNMSANTDAIAFETALNYHTLPEGSNVLVFGNGAMAKLAIQLCLNRSFNVFKLNRDLEVIPIKPSQVTRISVPELVRFDLLINCTPFGLSSNDAPERLPMFDALIDLPYRSEPTTLVLFAQERFLPYTDGFQFWVWQAREQIRLFGFETELVEFLSTAH